MHDIYTYVLCVCVLSILVLSWTCLLFLFVLCFTLSLFCRSYMVDSWCAHPAIHPEKYDIVAINNVSFFFSWTHRSVITPTIPKLTTILLFLVVLDTFFRSAVALLELFVCVSKEKNNFLFCMFDTCTSQETFQYAIDWWSWGQLCQSSHIKNIKHKWLLCLESLKLITLKKIIITKWFTAVEFIFDAFLYTNNKKR